MRFNYIFALVIVCSIISCKSKEAFDYNQFLVKMENDIAKDIEFTENKVKEHANSGAYDSISVVSARMKRIIQGKIDEINMKKLPDAKNAAEFRTAYVDYFRFMQQVYESYEEYGDQATEDGRIQASQKVVDVTGRKDEVVAKIKEVQRQYAKGNGFKLEQ